MAPVAPWFKAESLASSDWRNQFKSGCGFRLMRPMMPVARLAMKRTRMDRQKIHHEAAMNRVESD